MRKLGKAIIDFFTNAIQSLVSVTIVIVYSKFWAYRKIKNSANKKSCWILANGPSLTEDLQKIKKESRTEFDLFVVNEFCFSEKFEELQPEYYVIIDPAYWTFNQNEVEEIVVRFYKTMNEKVNWNLKMYVPFSGYKKVQKKIVNSNVEIIPFNNTPVKGFAWLETFLYNYNWGVTQLQNVVVGTIYIAIFKNYINVNLVGVDHDWHKNIIVDENNYVVWANNHFYDEQSDKKVYQRIFSGKDFFDMQQIFQALSLTHQSYKKLALYAKYKNVAVNNYTTHSCIDAFERK